MALDQITSLSIAPDAITPALIADGAISYQNCDWYSPNVANSTGALKLPRGTTAERPTTVLGGREVVTFDLTTAQPDLVFGDPGFDMMDPWQWSWTANYNRVNPQTNLTVNGGETVSGLTLLRGSTYTFRNFTRGHMLWLKTQALSQAEYNAGQVDLYRLGVSDGVTNNGAKRTNIGDGPASVTWTIPLNYPHNQVVIQHGQYGMDNTVAIANAPAETLGYIRLNTQLGSDETTGVGLEYYTGQAWVEVGSQPDFQILTHPTGTLTTEDWQSASGTDDWQSGTGTEDWGSAIVTAFLDDGNLSVNADHAVVAHDGVTGGGIPMLRADMSNLSVSLVNTKYNFLRADSQTLTGCATSGSNTSRLAFANAIETGVSNILLSDSNKKITINKNVTNSYFKFELKLKPSDNCTFEVWKNGSKLTYADYEVESGYHRTITWVEAASFGDYFELRLKTSSTDSITINNTDTLLIEFIGS